MIRKIFRSALGKKDLSKRDLDNKDMKNDENDKEPVGLPESPEDSELEQKVSIKIEEQIPVIATKEAVVKEARDPVTPQVKAELEPVKQTRPEKISRSPRGVKENRRGYEEEDYEEDEDEVSEYGGEEGGYDDPLSPAFDLERGDPLRAPGDDDFRRKTPWKSRIVSSKEFFSTEILYRYDILHVDDKEKMVGRYCLDLKGPQGGTWTLVIENELSVINQREEAETVLTMQQKDFLQIINGELNPQLAVLSQKVKLTGDIRKGILLQNLLAPEEGE